MSQSTLVLIPAHNEAPTIGAVLDGIRTHLPDADILVIDDCSGDGTGAIVRQHGALTVRHTFNLGYGAALQTGYHYAMRHGYERIVQMDGDGQHDPKSLPDLMAPLENGYDVVVGTRYRRGNAPAQSFSRRVGTKLFAWIVTKWTGIEITDPTSGYQAMTRRALREVAHESFPEDYPDADVLIGLHRNGIRLTETPVDMHERIAGVSMHRGSRVAFYAYKMALTLPLLPIRRRALFRDGRRETPVEAT